MPPPSNPVSERAWSDAPRLAERFGAGVPFRHIVIDDFLDPAFAAALTAQFPAFDRGNHVGDDGRRGGKSTVEKIARIAPCFAELDALVKSSHFLDWLGQVTGIDDLLYDPAYFGGGTHSNRQGQELHAHIDFNYHPGENWHRRLNLIVYLNADWNDGWGGNLELYRDPYADAAPTTRIAPLYNRCVVFETTEHSWHGFDAIRLPPGAADQTRKSVAFYFYTRERPSAETAGRHSTHYVNRQLPEHLVAGHTLDKDDVRNLHHLVAQRDELMQRLYAENASLLQMYDGGTVERLLRALKRVIVRNLRRD